MRAHAAAAAAQDSLEAVFVSGGAIVEDAFFGAQAAERQRAHFHRAAAAAHARRVAEAVAADGAEGGPEDQRQPRSSAASPGSQGSYDSRSGYLGGGSGSGGGAAGSVFASPRRERPGGEALLPGAGSGPPSPHGGAYDP